LAIVKDLEKAK